MTTTASPVQPHAVVPPPSSRRHDALAWAALAGRLLLAAVLGYAALTKIGDPAATVRAVRAYRLLPEAVAVPFAHALPAAELALAVLLLLGVALRVTATATAVLLGAFVVGIASAAARGLQIDCGCFGGGGATSHPTYALELLRDGALLAVAVGVALVGRSRWSLDPRPPGPAPHDEPGHSGAARRRHRTAVARHEAAQQRVARRLRVHRGLAGGAVAAAALLGIAASGQSTATTPSTGVPRGVTAAGGVLVGSPSAPHRVVAYEDPQCPVCADFERVSGPVLARAVDQGLVSVEYRMRSFLGPESVRAVAALGAAADAGRFAPLHALLYAHQPVEHTGGYTIEELLRLGAAAGLTDARFTAAVRAQSYAGWARSVDDRASRDGNVATPQLLLDGEVLDREVTFAPAALAQVLGVR